MISSSAIRRRLVVYFSGFDPAGPARYHKLYSQQAPLAAPLLQAEIHVSELKYDAAASTAQWQISYQPSNHIKSNSPNTSSTVETDYLFARWDDIAKKHWPKLNRISEICQFTLDFFSTHWFFIRSGAMRKIAMLDKAPTGMLLMPLFLALGLLFLGLTSSALLIFSIASNHLAAISDAAQFPAKPIATYSILLTVIWCIGMILLDRHWHMLWVMRSYIFTSRHARGLAPEIEMRLDHLAEKIHQKISQDQYDEILIVGHSTGTIMATLVISRIFERLPPEYPISLLTLGQWWPWLGYLPSAQFAQDRLCHIAGQTSLSWVDVSAKADGCCFSFVDPLVTLKDLPSPCNHPKLVSARWHTLFPKQTYRQLRKNPFRIHMQYLYASPKLGACDFFAITAGSLSLAERFVNVPSAKSQK
jgi:hypothetical protein